MNVKRIVYFTLFIEAIHIFKIYHEDSYLSTFKRKK